MWLKVATTDAPALLDSLQDFGEPTDLDLECVNLLGGNAADLAVLGVRADRGTDLGDRESKRLELEDLANLVDGGARVLTVAGVATRGHSDEPVPLVEPDRLDGDAAAEASLPIRIGDRLSRTKPSLDRVPQYRVKSEVADREPSRRSH